MFALGWGLGSGKGKCRTGGSHKWQAVETLYGGPHMRPVAGQDSWALESLYSLPQVCQPRMEHNIKYQVVNTTMDDQERDFDREEMSSPSVLYMLFFLIFFK